MSRFSSVRRFTAYPVKVHLGHWDHPLNALHYEVISTRATY